MSRTIVIRVGGGNLTLAAMLGLVNLDTNTTSEPHDLQSIADLLHMGQSPVGSRDNDQDRFNMVVDMRALPL